MKKLLVILCTIFFSGNVLYSFDFSGTYQGLECRGVCKEDSKLDEFAKSPLILLSFSKLYNFVMKKLLIILCTIFFSGSLYAFGDKIGVLIVEAQ